MELGDVKVSKPKLLKEFKSVYKSLFVVHRAFPCIVTFKLLTPTVLIVMCACCGKINRIINKNAFYLSVSQVQGLVLRTTRVIFNLI